MESVVYNCNEFVRCETYYTRVFDLEKALHEGTRIVDASEECGESHIKKHAAKSLQVEHDYYSFKRICDKPPANNNRHGYHDFACNEVKKSLGHLKDYWKEYKSEAQQHERILKAIIETGNQLEPVAHRAAELPKIVDHSKGVDVYAESMPKVVKHMQEGSSNTKTFGAPDSLDHICSGILQGFESAFQTSDTTHDELLKLK